MGLPGIDSLSRDWFAEFLGQTVKENRKAITERMGKPYKTLGLHSIVVAISKASESDTEPPLGARQQNEQSYYNASWSEPDPFPKEYDPSDGEEYKEHRREWGRLLTQTRREGVVKGRAYED